MFDVAVDQASVLQPMIFDPGINQASVAAQQMSNGKWKVDYELENFGNRPIQNAQVRFYQSKDLAIDKSDQVIGSSQFNLALGESSDLTRLVNLNRTFGNHLLIKVDPNNTLSEGNENNNFASVPVGLDLSITNGQVVFNQDYLHVSYSVQHDGLPSIPTTSKVYLDGQEISTLPVNSLKEGQQRGFYHLIKLGNHLKGSHEVKVVVDSSNLNLESNETNNTWLFPIKAL